MNYFTLFETFLMILVLTGKPLYLIFGNFKILNTLPNPTTEFIIFA